MHARLKPSVVLYRPRLMFLGKYRDHYSNGDRAPTLEIGTRDSYLTRSREHDNDTNGINLSASR